MSLAARSRSAFSSREGCFALSAILFCFAVSLSADDKPRKADPDEMPLPLFGGEYPVELSGAVALLGAGGPLQQSVLPPAAEAIRLRESRTRVARAEARLPIG